MHSQWNGETESYEDCDFDDLPEEVKKAAKFLGFTRAIWDKDGKIPIESKPWVGLTPEQRKAAKTMGYTKEKWDNESDSESDTSESKTETQVASSKSEKKDVNYDDLDFQELPPEVKEAAKFLGYTKKIWNRDGKIPLEDNDWDELTPEQQKAALVMGYNREKWDAESDSDSDSDESEPLHKPITTKTLALKSSLSSETTESDSAPARRQTHVGMDGSGRHQSYGCSLTQYGKYLFDELPRGVQKAATDLGFTKSTWDRNLFVPRQTKTWDRLKPAEFEAAMVLGCSEERWQKHLDANW